MKAHPDSTVSGGAQQDSANPPSHEVPIDGATGGLSVLLVGGGPVAEAAAERMAASSDLHRLLCVRHDGDGALGAATRRERRWDSAHDRLELEGGDTSYPTWSDLLVREDVGAVVMVPPAVGSERRSVGSVLAAMRLMSACRSAASVRKIVVVSDAAVYPCGPLSPSFFDEKHPTATGSTNGGDVAEIERLAQRAGRSRPDVEVVVLRLAPVIGPGTETVLARLLASAIPLKPAGYDARLQLLHVDDAAAAVTRAATISADGVFNIAAPGIVTMKQVALRQGRVPVAVPHGLLPRIAELAGVGEVTAEDVALLRFGRCLDVSRARRVLGFTPAYGTPAAVDDHIRANPPTSEPVAAVLLDLLGGGVAPRRAVDTVAVRMGLPSATEALEQAARMTDTAAKFAELPGVNTVLATTGRVADTAAKFAGLTDAHEVTATTRRVADTAAKRLGLPSAADVVRRVGRYPRTLAEQIRREHETDEYGLDREFLDSSEKWFLTPVFRDYLGLDTVGLDHIPDSGRVMIVANHSGTFPLDMVGLGYAVGFLHPARRTARVLGGDLVAAVPYIGDVLHRMGCVPACHDDASRLLDADEVVVVCPEGYKGLGKPYSQRYRLQRFGRGGFVKAALRSGAPLIPAAVFGAEELYPMLSQARPLAKLLGLPYFPITPTLPWLGPLGLIPRRSRLTIEFGEPIPTAHLGPEAADDAETVLEISDRIRDWIQSSLNDRLAERD
ncbi:1-acyl-sn-glycerol-3-phosphate acyltransferase [Nocardia mexicana]|uniref:1-acyl-sn-glycerol-3-phosphate acyltransferase n=1 Tax=Nocardia mexicana TaxID=279262 RepID=A0A370GPP3_9NOCA|nr:1-acyl-sn-glycerol-3-phosphate acyltransferase [Nocardia mexicana]RDI45280.1 1-acyl-sn-glycerol-3-phosphate acyltransferase [Nocardia mexicana]